MVHVAAWFAWVVVMPVVALKEGVIYTNASHGPPMQHDGRRMEGRRLTLTSAQKTAILNRHNQLRAGVTIPCTAADMETLTWDDSLASSSQAYAAQCVWRHDPTNGAHGWGENLAMSWSSQGNTYHDAHLENMVQGWYSEIDDTEWVADGTSVKSKSYDSPQSTCQSFDSSSGDCMIGHYTQVIWASTNKVGCGVVACSTGLMGQGGVYLVCKYTPAGNYAQGSGLLPPFMVGTSCAACSTCTSSLGTLCAVGDTPTRCKDAITTMNFNGNAYTSCASLIAGYSAWCSNSFETSTPICALTCGTCSVSSGMGASHCTTPVTPAPTPSPLAPSTAGGCSAPADHSRGECESCFHGDQCPSGYYCCPYMKKCVNSASMGCYPPIASCTPMCYDRSCSKATGCDCSQCLGVGPGKSYNWLDWASLRNSNSGTPQSASCPTPSPDPSPGVASCAGRGFMNLGIPCLQLGFLSASAVVSLGIQ